MVRQISMERSLSSDTRADVLSAWEVSIIEFFVRAANLIGLPKSIGEIYGLLFCAPDALTFDDLERRLQISRGSVSQGLKLLRQLGAVKVQEVVGSRKDYYLPELSMKQLVAGFVRDQFGPHLDTGTSRLDQIEGLIESETDAEMRAHAIRRLNTLRSWKRRTQKLLPLILAVLGGSNLLETAKFDRQVI